MTALSLSAHDRQALEALEERLAASDPRLAAMLSTFSRLEDGEAVPAREQIPAGKQRRPARQRPAGRARRPLLRNPRTVHIALALWVVMTIAIAIVIMTVLSHGGSRLAPRSHGCTVVAVLVPCGT